MSDPLHIMRRGSQLRVTFNRPERLNALTIETLACAADVVEAAASDASVRVIVLSGAGRAFSAGADLIGKEIQDVRGADAIDAANRLTLALRHVPKPVLAAVNGPAVGVGCSLALAADLTVARQSALFLLAFANVGLMPDGGATALIPALIGPARANRMTLLAEPVPAARAAEWGLISHVVPDEDFDTEVDRLATQLAQGPTAAYAQAKRAFNATALAHLNTALAAEREGQSHLFTTADFAEGVEAFAGKRTPQFSGK